MYTAILCVFALAVCEAALRVRAYIRYGGAGPTVRDPMMMFDSAADLYVPRPNFEVRGARVNIRINSLGFRGDEISRHKPPGTIRIAVLGASTTFNAEVSSNEMTWTHQLQQKLRDAYPGSLIEVINTSLGGYVSADNLKNLRHRVLPLDPDLVIYYEANNEIVRDTGELARQRGVITGGARSPVVAALSNYSLMFDLAYKNLTILAAGAAGPRNKIDAIPVDLPNSFIAALDQMRRDLADRGVPLMPSTFIVKYRRNQDRATQIANADVAFFYMPWMSIDGMLHAMDVYNQAILDFGARHQLMVVDDREAIPPDAEHFTDCMHLGDKGATAMAQRFFRYFQTHRVIEGLTRRGSTLAIAR